MLHICMIYNFTVEITRIHFTICKVQSDNSNPDLIHNKTNTAF